MNRWTIACVALFTLTASACVEPPHRRGKGEAKDQDEADEEADDEESARAGDKRGAPPSDPDFEGEHLGKQTLEGGLEAYDYVIGEGDEAKEGNSVSVNYTGSLDDGTVFDTSKKRNRPYTFTIGTRGVIKGWDIGVRGMKVGGKRRIVVPPELGYGSRDKGKIPPNSTLTFELELVAMQPPLPPGKGDEAFEGEPLEKKEAQGGLVIEEFASGEGPAAKRGDTVMVHYTGRMKDGTVFSSSVSGNKPIGFRLGSGRVIKGWEQGIVGMKVGGLRRLDIPAALAYGSRGKGDIPPDADLTFTVELMAIR